MAYLRSQGVIEKRDVLSLGGYRSNPDIVAAMTFSNPQILNLMAGEKGGITVHHPSGEVVSIFDAAQRYRASGTPLIVIAGENYGCGSSRVMAATGPVALGVRAIVAKNFESIHRGNLWQNGIAALCFQQGESAEGFGFDGNETWDIPLDELTAGSKTIKAKVSYDGGVTFVTLQVMLNSEQEFEFFRHGGAGLRELRDELANRPN